jgi:putative ABC transport system permease protein
MPEWAGEVRTRLAGLVLSPERDREIVDELSQHLEDRWQELMAGGASQEGATRLALAEFTSPDALARRMAPLRQSHVTPPVSLGAPSTNLLSDAWRDLRYTQRLIAREPGFASLVILLLIGSFSVLAVVLTLVGLYGTLAYLVMRRQREIGIRMAVGATRSQIRH